MCSEKEWRFLVVDDEQADAIEEFIGDDHVLRPPDKVVIEKCTKFHEAIRLLNEKRIDLIILDLKDDSNLIEDDNIPLEGEKVFEEIQKARFVPIIFYTAYTQKVEHLQNPYVRVVGKGEEKKLRSEINRLFDTGLPSLIRHLEEEQRSYMWDHIQKYWLDKTDKSIFQESDVSYLLARRLANILERDSIRRFLSQRDRACPNENDPTIHPIEIYIYPPIHSKLKSGDILQANFYDQHGYWIVLSPSCDIEHDKAENVIMASCSLLSDQPEYEKIQKNRFDQEDPSRDAKSDLENLIGNNRNTKVDGKRYQPGRFVFLPETFFIPALIIDFQKLIVVPKDQIDLSSRRVSLDSPFAEAYVSKFSQYYGRLGTPDFNKEIIYKRIINSIDEAIEEKKVTKR